MAVPGVASKEAGTSAVNCWPVTYVVASVAPFHCTTEAGRKPQPLTDRLKAPLPAIAENGFSQLSIGWEVSVNVSALEVPDGSETVMLSVPGVVVRGAGTVPTTFAKLIKLVGTLVPFHMTTDSAPNPLPYTLRPRGPHPALAEYEGSETRVGAADALAANHNSMPQSTGTRPGTTVGQGMTGLTVP
jgi:hypothetical protein